MHPQGLRELADGIARHLLIIFDVMVATGEVLESWRKTKVTPIFKKGKKDLRIYRLIYLTLICGHHLLSQDTAEKSLAPSFSYPLLNIASKILIFLLSVQTVEVHRFAILKTFFKLVFSGHNYVVPSS